LATGTGIERREQLHSMTVLELELELELELDRFMPFPYANSTIGGNG